MIEQLISLLVKFYLSSKFSQFVLVFSILSILGIVSILSVYLLRRKQRKDAIEKIKVHFKNEKEEAIYNILVQKKSCYQSTLSFLSQIPKSSLSEILDELEERNLINREIKGNKKLVSLKL